MEIKEGPRLGSASLHRQSTRREVSIPCLLESVARGNPASPAVIASGRAPLTYDRLRLHIHDVRNRLNAMGVGRNDRVAVVMPNGPEMIVAFAAFAASATFAPVNPRYRPGEFDAYFATLQPKAMIFQSGIHPSAVAVARRRGIPIIELVPNPGDAAGVFTLSGGRQGGTVSPGFAKPSDAALVLSTSGTTNQPKLVSLTHANICISARTIAANLALTVQDRCLSVMPLYHVHGLIGAVLSSLLAGVSIVCPPDFDESAFLECLEEFHPSWYTAVPAMHRAILLRAAAHADTIRRCPLRFIRSCSAPLPPEIMAELERVFDAPVIEAYGMTEASHEICSNPLPPGPRKAGSVGVPTGCELAILDEAGTLLPPGALGEIAIRGPNVVAGYEGDPTANATAFVNGWFRTGDQGMMDRQGYVFITGRLKENINRGGVKIAPGEIEGVLSEHPAIAQAVVYGIPHSTLGEDIGAAVVVRADTITTEDEIRKFAATRLADFRVPSRVVIVDHIPTSATGKLQRSTLADKLAPSLKPPFVAPGDRLEAELAEIWADVLGVSGVGIQDNFFELGGHSLLAGRILSSVREKFCVDVSLRSFFAAPTVAGLATTIVEHLVECIEAEAMARMLEELRRLSDEDARRLVMLPEARGNPAK